MESYFSFILYPVSAILWFWHKVFGTVLGPDNGFAWALSVFFLVFSLRVVLLKPALSQLRAGRRMAKFAPQIQKLREKYKNDRQRMAQEMQKLQSEHGVNPLGGCLPALLQIPVFLSLFHVLRNFTPTAQSNFIFDRAGVESFINADIFGAKLSNWISQPADQLALFGTDRTSMMIVGIPLMLTASVATFFTMRLSVKKQTDAAMANPQSAMMAKFMMYIAPVGAIISGWFLPIAVLLYWLANNFWTLGQQHFLTKKIDHEQEREKAKEIEAKKSAPRPKPGQKPVRAEAKSDEPGAEPAAATATDADQQVTKSSSNGQRPGGGRPGGKKNQPKNRPGKQAAAAKKGKKRR
ncbi:membrane protein insertase YidC [Saccharopolyspora phatthalungensis]|uniref:Membrane protein insertase YidC n=1 Tax=Saccharopolyspora phatthalungensis TaxID=664693 RepID=A0A840Q472_9PSEU|nr:membrane protein insertase YidC [Saccharopolyspora phatthalungensis]MBB5153499.1 YidC/Oxa1 family membrane protein insertase [Saccharopolyspora phatthalungensis]